MKKRIALLSVLVLLIAACCYFLIPRQVDFSAPAFVIGQSNSLGEETTVHIKGTWNPTLRSGVCAEFTGSVWLEGDALTSPDHTSLSTMAFSRSELWFYGGAFISSLATEESPAETKGSMWIFWQEDPERMVIQITDRESNGSTYAVTGCADWEEAKDLCQMFLSGTE